MISIKWYDVRNIFGDCLAFLWAPFMRALVRYSQTAINLFSGCLLSSFCTLLIFQEKGHIGFFFFFNYTILLNFRKHVLWPRQIQAKLPTVGISPCNKNGSFMMTCEATQAAKRVVCPLYLWRKDGRQESSRLFEIYAEQPLGRTPSVA